MLHRSNLNPDQKLAVESTTGPLLIIAGAGAGKTKTLISRIEHLIAEGVPSEQILAITFTNKAAGEMRDRLNQTLRSSGVINQVTTATFHGLGVRILRQYGHRMNLPDFFTILDREAALSHIKSAIKELGLDPKEWPPRRFLHFISRQKNKGYHDSRELPEETGGYFSAQARTVWSLYQKNTAAENSLDFDDILIKTLVLLKNHPDVAQTLQNRWRYLHIDEYQDTNDVQYELSKLITGPEKNICIIGDQDQSIYGWRGANSTNINRFEQDFPETRTVILKDNYRSTKTILKAANLIIEKNQNRKEKELRANKQDDQPITFYCALDEKDEARWAAREIKKMIDQGHPPDEIAILYRANFQSRVLEEACLLLDIPYQVVGVRFFQRKEIKDLLSFVQAALIENDWSSRKRASKAIPCGIGEVTFNKWSSGHAEKLPTRTRKKVFELEEKFSQIKQLVPNHPPAEVLRQALVISGLKDHLELGDDEDRDRLANLWELINLAENYSETGPDALAELLAEAALASDQDELKKDRTGVKLMTVHAAKGLEFQTVFVVGLEEGIFPYQHQNQAEGEPRDEEEERRLFYVALTRAKTKLFLSYAERRMVFGQSDFSLPSSYLTDLNSMINISSEEPTFFYD